MAFALCTGLVLPVAGAQEGRACCAGAGLGRVARAGRAGVPADGKQWWTQLRLSGCEESPTHDRLRDQDAEVCCSLLIFFCFVSLTHAGLLRHDMLLLF